MELWDGERIGGEAENEDDDSFLSPTGLLACFGLGVFIGLGSELAFLRDLLSSEIRDSVFEFSDQLGASMLI